MGKKTFYDKASEKFNMEFLLGRYSEDIILAAYVEAEQIHKDYLKYEIDSIKKDQGFITPLEEEELAFEESDVWSKVEDIIKEGLEKVDVVKKITEERKGELSELRKATENVEKLFNLDKEFLDCFNEYSFYNEDIGKNLFYVMLSLLTKKYVKVKFGNGVQNILHLFIIMSSGCLEENTIIHTNKGYMPIKNLAENDKVLTYNFHTKEQELKKAIKINSGEKELFEITLENGNTIQASEDHIFFIKREGKIIEEKLRNLTEDDVLLKRIINFK